MKGVSKKSRGKKRGDIENQGTLTQLVCKHVEKVWRSFLFRSKPDLCTSEASHVLTIDEEMVESKSPSLDFYGNPFPMDSISFDDVEEEKALCAYHRSWVSWFATT